MKQNQLRMMKEKTTRISILLSVLLVVVLLVSVSPAAFAAGPLFHAKPGYEPAPQQPAAPTVTLEALGEANSYENLIRKHGGFAVETTCTPEADEEGSYSFFYGAENYNYYAYAPVMGEDSTLAELITKADVYSLNQKADGKTEYSIKWNAAPDAADNTYDLKATAMALDEEALLDYDIEMVMDNGDGTLTVVLIEKEPEIVLNGAGSDELSTDPFAETDEPYPWDDAEAYDQSDDDGWHDGDDYTYEEPVDWDNDAYSWTGEPITWDAYSGGYGGSGYSYYGPNSHGPYGWGNSGYNQWNNDPYGPENGWRTPADAWNYSYEAWDNTPDAWYDDAFGDETADVDEKTDTPVTNDVEQDGDVDLWTADWEFEAQSVLTFVVDAKTLEIMSIRESAVLEDGREILLSDQTLTYSMPDSQTLNDMLVMAYHYENEDMVNPRTVTVVYDYGTMDEMLCSRTVEKGDLLYTTFLPGYELYSDPFGTYFEGSDGQSDVMIYAYPDDKEWVAADPAPDGFLAPSNQADTVTELDFEEANYTVFEANKLDSILKNHSSVEYRLVFAGEEKPGYPDYVYETADLAYAESPTTAVYVGNGNYYELSEDATGSNLYYVFDFSNEYDPFLNVGYEIVPETYEEWWNPAEESAVRCYEQNGEIHLISASSAEKSRSFVENYLLQTYNGETVTSEAVADAETGELIRFIYQMEKDGEVSQPLTYEVSYDLSEPRACRNLRAAAERGADQVAAITLVENPGTENEQVQTKVLPIGSNAVYVANDRMALFEDEACTVPAGQWDKMTDHTYYMIPVSDQADAA